MMFSDYVRAIGVLVDMSTIDLIALVVCVGIFAMMGKLLRAFLRAGHWFLLLLGGAFFAGFASEMMHLGIHVLAMIFAVPLLFIGWEAYHRLLGVR